MTDYQRCEKQGHKRARHSPDGFSIIEECPQCCMAFHLHPAIAFPVRMHGSSYEKRLTMQASQLARLIPRD